MKLRIASDGRPHGTPNPETWAQMNTPDARIYVGRLEEHGLAVYAVGETTVERLDAADAAADLARVLLSDASSLEPTPDECRQFCAQILSRLPKDGFALQRDTINAWLPRSRERR